jgi:hypothetical protein
VISPSGDPYVAWQANGSDELGWAKWTPSGWRATVVNGDGTTTSCYDPDLDWLGPSAAFGPEGRPQIASVCMAVVAAGAKVLYTTRIAGVWTTKTVGHGPTDTCGISATDIDLIDNPANARPVIAITDWCTGAVTGFFYDGTSWKKKTMLPGGLTPLRYGALSLAVDPSNGKLAMALNSDIFGRGSILVQEYGWRGGIVRDSRVDFTLPNGDLAWSEPSLAFLPDGTGYVAFQEGTPFDAQFASSYRFLALATRTSGTWGAPAVVDDGVQFTGADPSLSLAGDTIHIAYRDVTNADLRYATSPDGSTWLSERIKGADATGYYPSLGITVAGTAWISFYDGTKNALLASIGP